jgi:hypothetical protein
LSRTQCATLNPSICGSCAVDRSQIELRSDGKALAVYEAGERRGTVPLKLIERVVLRGTIALDTGVLTRLAESGAVHHPAGRPDEPARGDPAGPETQRRLDAAGTVCARARPCMVRRLVA